MIAQAEGSSKVPFKVFLKIGESDIFAFFKGEILNIVEIELQILNLIDFGVINVKVEIILNVSGENAQVSKVYAECQAKILTV